MDNNTADVLKSLIEVGCISSIFWAAALGMRWQYQYGKIVDTDDENDDDEDDEGDDVEDSGNIRGDGSESCEYIGTQCPSVHHCPYRAEFELRYSLEDRKLFDTAVWYVSIMLATLFLGIIVGLLLTHEQHIMFG